MNLGSRVAAAFGSVPHLSYIRSGLESNESSIIVTFYNCLMETFQSNVRLGASLRSAAYTNHYLSSFFLKKK